MAAGRATSGWGRTQPSPSRNLSNHCLYRALKELGFSHVSARPKAYKQDPEAMEAFKKTFPPAWPRSALSLRLAHR